MHYRNFDLKLFGDEQKGFFVELISGPLGERTETFPLQLDLSEVNAWSDQVKSGKADREDLKTFGKLLFQALFPKNIGEYWRGIEKKLGQKSFLRLRLDIRTQILATIPWEIAYDNEEQYHLAMAGTRPIVRYLFNQDPVESIEISQPLRILLAVAAYAAPQALNATESEIEFINRSFEELVKKGLVEQPFSLSPATFDGLQRELQKNYHVLHFMGHGKFAGDAGHLIMEDENGGTHELDSETFKDLLLKRDLRLLVLNACETANPSQFNPMLGVAYAARMAGIPAVIAMQGPVEDEIALVFARAFYSALALGQPLETCMAEGRIAVMSVSEFSDWAIPVLYSNSLDGLLWRAPDALPHPQPLPQASLSTASPKVMRGSVQETDFPAPERARRRVLHNLTSADYATFFNREKESSKIMEAMNPGERVALVNIFGVGGTGRSSLAREIAQRCLEFSNESPDDPAAFEGIVWVSGQRVAATPEDAQNAHPSSVSSMDDVCFTVGRALKEKALVQARPEERLALMDDILREGRYLLILDDADEIEAEGLLLFLKNIPIPTKVIVISHSPLGAGGIQIPLSGLDDETATQLLAEDARLYEVTAVEKASPDELQRLVELSDALPIILRWSVAQLRDSGQPISWIIELLKRAGDQSLVEYCLERSIKDLTTEQRRLLKSFVIFPQPTRAEFAGRAAGQSVEELNRSLTRLQLLRLIRLDSNSQQYRPMFMVRQYVQKELEADSAFKQEATRRAIESMYGLAEETKSSGSDEKRDALETEIPNIIWAAQQAFNLQQWQTVHTFWHVLEDFLSDHGYWNESIQLGHWAYRAAQELNKAEEVAWRALYPLAQLHFYQGAYDEAQRWAEHGFKLFSDLQNEYGMAAAERLRGRVFHARGDLESAKRSYTDGLRMARKFNSTDSHFNQQGDLLSSLAGLAETQEQWPEARDGYKQALALFEKTHNRKGIVAMLHRLGSVAFAEGQDEEAERLLRESLSQLEEDWVSREAKINYTFALLQEKRGHLQKALELLTQVRQEFQSLSATADLARADAALTRVSATIAYQQRRQQQS